MVSDAAPVRLAIVPQAQTLRGAADFLTVALSTNDQVALVERAQLDKALREQSLASASSKDVVKLGELLGADGVLTLELPQTEDLPQVIATLVATKPGVVLSRTSYEWPSFEPARWAELVTRQMRDLFPKLAVLPRDALPLSILNLRASVESLESAALERDLTRMLYDRLIREREVFVLERRSLQTLAAEKELKGLADRAFWSGGYLLEGIINKEGFTAGKVTISGRMVPPEKTNWVSLELSGARTNLGGLMNELATRILSTLKRRGAGAEWSALAEAERYFEEAKWAYRWQMFGEARAAAESSWALGKQTSELAELRIKAYRECAGDPGACVIDNGARYVNFGRPLEARVNNFGQLAAIPLPPDPERVADVVEALDLYTDALRRWMGPEAKLPPGWFALGCELLDRAGWWLRYYYFTIDARAGQEEGIVHLKHLSIAIEAALAKHPSIFELDPNRTLLSLKARHAAFWVDTPEQGLAIYRGILEAGDWARVRSRFLNEAYAEAQSFMPVTAAAERADLASPCLAGWEWKDRKRCPAVWRGFIDELCQSTNVALQLEGRYLRSSYAWAQDEYEETLRKLLDYVWSEREVFAAPSFDPNLMSDLGKLMQIPAMNRFDRGLRTTTFGPAWEKFQRDFGDLRKQRESALADLKARQDHILWLESRKSYLRTQGTYDVYWFTSHILHQSFQPEEAKELLTLLIAFKARVDANSTNAVSARRYPLYDDVERTLRNASSPPPAPTNAVAQTIKPPPRDLPPKAAPPPTANTPTNVLEAKRFWAIPASPPRSEREVFPHVASCRYRDGRLWVEARYSSSGQDRADFFNIDLETFQSEIVRFADAFLPGPIPPVFEVFNGSVYLCLSDNVVRYDLARRKWEPFPLPVTGQSHPSRRGERMFFTTDTSILECMRDGTFRLLASTRRRPAMTALDTLEHLGVPALFMAPNSELRASIGGVAYSLRTAGGDWDRLSPLPTGQAYSLSEDGVFSGGRLGREEELWVLRGNDTAFELLFRQSTGPQFATPRPMDRPITNAPMWQAPDGVLIINQPSCIQDDGIWFLPRPPEAHAAEPATTWESSLLRFTSDEDEPVKIPLRLSWDAKAAPPRGTRSRLADLRNRTLTFYSTPKGFIVSLGVVPGFWFISKADLEPFIQPHDSQRRAELEASNLRRARLRQEVLTAFGRDGSGLQGFLEKEAAIADSRYLELELPNIDANHNGLLDAAELAFFDANTNRLLEAAEQAGIEITLTNLAEKLFAKLDRDKNRRLDTNEIPAHLVAQPFGPRMAVPLIQEQALSRDGTLGKEGMISAMQRRLLTELRRLGAGGPPTNRGATPPPNFHDILKERVEDLWRQDHARGGNVPQTNSSAASATGTTSTPKPPPP